MGLERLPRKVKYDLEPQPSSLTPSERLQEGAISASSYWNTHNNLNMQKCFSNLILLAWSCAGLRAFFLENPGIEPAPERLVQQDTPDSVPLTTVHVGYNQPTAVSKPGTGVSANNP